MTLRWVPGWNGLTEPEAVSYVAAVEAADGQDLEFGVARAINDFVVGCKNDGIWDAIKACCILAGARTTNGALVPLVGDAPTSYNFDLVGDTDYNRVTGLKGDGSTKYLDSNRNNNADPQNSQHLSVYASAQATSSANAYPFYISVGYSDAGSSQIGRLASNGNLFTRNRSSSFDASSPSSDGFLAMNRSQSSLYTTRFASSNNTIAQVSGTPINGNVYVFWSSGAQASDYSDARLSFYSIGESLDLAKLDTRVSSLMTAIGAAIP
jgi:hypothetical protein